MKPGTDFKHADSIAMAHPGKRAGVGKWDGVPFAFRKTLGGGGANLGGHKKKGNPRVGGSLCGV